MIEQLNVFIKEYGYLIAFLGNLVAIVSFAAKLIEWLIK